MLLEDMNHKFDLLLELLSPMKQIQQDVGSLKEDMSQVKQDVKIIKAAVTDLSHQVSNQDRRLTHLENTS